MALKTKSKKYVERQERNNTYAKLFAYSNMQNKSRLKKFIYIKDWLQGKKNDRNTKG